MAGKIGNDDDVIADINVTPLVDIMLVLLIIFMLTANLIAKQAIEVELPKAAQGSTPPATTLAITLTRAGGSAGQFWKSAGSMIVSPPVWAKVNH